MAVDVQPAIGAPSLSAWQPRIVAFCCNWCSYAGADLAGTSRISYPASVRIIRVPCSGRVNPRLVLRALLNGADAVLVAGCHPGDCHYGTGNYFARRRLAVAARLLEFMGFAAERLHVTWISGSEGPQFADTIRQLTDRVAALGPNRGPGETVR